MPGEDRHNVNYNNHAIYVETRFSFFNGGSALFESTAKVIK